MSLPLFVFLGDSLTQHGFAPSGFLAQLANSNASFESALIHIRVRRLLTKGLSGYNSKYWTRVVQHIPLADLYVLLLGANDAVLPAFPQHVPIEEYKENIRSIVENLKNSRVLLVTPPIVEPTMWKRPDDRTLENTSKYADAVRELATELNLPVVDLFAATMTAKKDHRNEIKAIVHDGLHLGSLGNDLLATAIDEAIATNYPEFSAEKLPMMFPYWADIGSDKLDKIVPFPVSEHDKA